MKKSWTEEEVKYLMENWNNCLLNEIICKLNRTEDSIVRKARRLGLDVRKNDECKLKKEWNEKEDDFLINNYKLLSVAEISERLKRTPNAVQKRAITLKIAEEIKRWTNEEEEYLSEKWGIMCIDSIAKKLKRTRSAVLLKAHQLSLREQIIANGAYLTPKDISEILGINVRTLYSWIDENKIRCRKFKVGKSRKYQISVEALCDFLERYQEKWDTKKADMAQIRIYYVSYLNSCDGGFVIKEGLPKWLLEKIRSDKNITAHRSAKPWTTRESRELAEMLKKKYKYKDICVRLDRSMEAIKTRASIIKRIEVQNLQNQYK